MAYIKTEWKNREVERPRTYNIQENEDGTVTLIPAEGTIIEPGTPIIAENMNKIEDALVTFDEHKADYEQYQITVNNTYAKKQQPALNLITLQNGWMHEDYNGLIYRVNEFGEIELDGKIYNGNTAGNTTIGQIPLEILPAGRQIMLRVIGFDSSSAIVPVYLWIHSNTREIKFYGSGQPSLCFDGITIREGR